MVESETLQFENGRALQNLYANDLRLLQALEEKLDLKVTTRDGWLKLEGERNNIEKARQLFGQLEAARQRGMQIHRHEFQYALDVVSGRSQESLGQLAKVQILGSSRRTPISPKTSQQLTYVQAIQACDIVFGIGPAGTGKTYLAMAMAVEALKRETVKRVILTRPAVEAGEALGFLPGDLTQKVDPYLRPMYDALYEMLGFERVAKLIERNVIEVAPLAFMRGRTLNESFIILDEAQNTTVEQMKMFLTRIGFGSVAVVTGDITQIDLPKAQTSGLKHAMQVLDGVPSISFTHFRNEDVVRHPLVQAIVRAYDAHEKKTKQAE